MGREEDREEAWWLGGETQVYPCMDKRKPRSLKYLLSGSMLLLAGMGIGRLAGIGSETRDHGRQQDHRRESGTSTPSERNETMGQQRDMDRSAQGGAGDESGAGIMLAAFGLGLVTGVVAALLTTPESGPSVRHRLKRGMDTAKKEFDETVGEAKQDWSAVGDGIYDSVKRTASRVKQAADVTKEAMTDRHAADGSVRRVP